MDGSVLKNARSSIATPWGEKIAKKIEDSCAKTFLAFFLHPESYLNLYAGDAMELTSLYQGVLLPFQIDKTPVQGAFIRLCDTFSSTHFQNYSPPVCFFASQVLVTTLGLSRFFKKNVTFQFHLRASGLVDKLTIEVRQQKYFKLKVLTNDHGSFEERPLSEESIFELIGRGYVSLTVFEEGCLPLQDIFSLRGKTFLHMMRTYFGKNDEQNLDIRVAASVHPVCASALVLKVPHSRFSPSHWKAIQKKAHMISDQDMLNPKLSYEDVLSCFPITHPQEDKINEVVCKCDCHREGMKKELRKKNAEELSALTKNGLLEILCDFCHHVYAFRIEDFQRRFSER